MSNSLEQEPTLAIDKLPEEDPVAIFESGPLTVALDAAGYLGVRAYSDAPGRQTGVVDFGGAVRRMGVVGNRAEGDHHGSVRDLFVRTERRYR